MDAQEHLCVVMKTFQQKLKMEHLKQNMCCDRRLPEVHVHTEIYEETLQAIAEKQRYVSFCVC